MGDRVQLPQGISDQFLAVPGEKCQLFRSLLFRSLQKDLPPFATEAKGLRRI